MNPLNPISVSLYRAHSKVALEKASPLDAQPFIFMAWEGGLN